jgi:DNA-directed RNA polymerase specialized sigma24 family protein
VREKQVEDGGTAEGKTARGVQPSRADSPLARQRAEIDAPAQRRREADVACGSRRGTIATASEEFRGTLDRDPSAAATPGAWRQWLAGGSSREVLARIVPEDPLEIREHVASALRDGAYLMDAQRVALRCFALVARHALRYRGRPELLEWLQALARESILAILRDDGEAERKPVAAGREPGREHGEAFAALAKPLGLEPDAMGRACLAFNRLPHADRAAFFALVIAGRSLEELVRQSGESATEIARRARRALDAILAAAANDAPSNSETRKGK